MSRAVPTVYLDWNVVSTWADLPQPPQEFYALCDLVHDGRCAVVYSREHVREATVGWRSGLENQRRAVHRLCLLDALTWNLVSLRENEELGLSTVTPFHTLTTVLEDMGDEHGVMNHPLVAEKIPELRAAHNLAINTLQAHTSEDLSRFLIDADEPFNSMLDLANEANFRTTEANLWVARTSALPKAPKELNNYDARMILDFVRCMFAGVDGLPPNPTFADLVSVGDRFITTGPRVTPRAAQGNAILNAIGYFRDGKKAGGRSMTYDALHAEYGSFCGAFVTADVKLHRRFALLCELLEFRSAAVHLADLGGWLARLAESSDKRDISAS